MRIPTILLRQVLETEHSIARVNVADVPKQREPWRLRYRHCHRKVERERERERANTDEETEGVMQLKQYQRSFASTL